MMSQQDDMIQSQDPRPVTQEDRDAAADLLAYQGKPKLYTDDVREGIHDAGPTVQWFARHRIAGIEEALCPHGKRPGEAWCEPCFRAEQRQRWGYSPHDFCDFMGRGNG